MKTSFGNIIKEFHFLINAWEAFMISYFIWCSFLLLAIFLEATYFLHVFLQLNRHELVEFKEFFINLDISCSAWKSSHFLWLCGNYYRNEDKTVHLHLILVPTTWILGLYLPFINSYRVATILLFMGSNMIK